MRSRQTVVSGGDGRIGDVEGAQLPHFEVIDIHGRRISYRTGIWQRKYLLLVTPASDGRHQRSTYDDLQRLTNDDVAVVVAGQPVPGIPPAAFVIADRWGEIAKVWTGGDTPSVPDLEDWITHVRMRCPECEGEAY